MNKVFILSISLFITGIICFYSAVDSCRTIQILQETPIIYDSQTNKLIRDAVAETSTHLSFLIILSLIWGLTAWILASIFIVKRNSIVSKK